MKSRALVILAVSMVGAGCNRQPVVIQTAPPPTPVPQIAPAMAVVPEVLRVPVAPVARTENFETHALRREIDAFDRSPSAVQSARVKKAFAELDGEIAELIEHVARKTGDEQAKAARKLADLRTYRDAEQVRFLRLEALAPLQTRAASEPLRDEGTGEKIGQKIDDAARKVENKLRDAAETVRDRTR